jgi:hypothetical protein
MTFARRPRLVRLAEMKRVAGDDVRNPVPARLPSRTGVVEALEENGWLGFCAVRRQPWLRWGG